VLTARAGRLRDWALFAAAALVPALSVGVLGLRALTNEEAGARRQAALELAAGADRTSRDLERILSETSARLATAPLDPNPARLATSIRALAPPFAEPVVLAPDRSLLTPPPPATLPEAAPPARCRKLVAALSAHDPDEANVRSNVLATCAEARTPEGRWVYPLVALDAIRRREAVPDGLVAWLDTHAGLLGAAEREATRIEVRDALAGPALDHAMRALAASGSRRDTLLAELRSPGASDALRAPPTHRGLVAWRAGASVGSLRALDDGTLAGFVVHAASLADALAANAIALPPETSAEVLTGAQAATAAAARGPDDRPWAIARVAPDLAIRLAPADPRAIARHASRSRALLAGIGVAATALAFSMAALLFARMRAARRSSELRTDFVSAVSHELRTPIASVRMLAELLEQDRVEPDEQREVYEALAREARRLGETVDRLLGFSRMAAGRYVLDRAEASVAEPVRASIDTFEERHPEAAKVERDLDDEARASIDAGQIRLAVDNLLANARKYAPEGGPYRVRVARERGGVAITVADRGPGIARRDQRRIFDPFERADDRLSRATEGSGIGLSLVRHVARAHGGHASVESEPGRGAAFTLWIPGARS
jgi:signal transduction histidine kinase